MPVLHFDVESRSTVNLTDVGAWRYAADPTTEILCLTYAVDDGAVETWTPGQPIPKPFATAARNSKWRIVSHGQFEIAIATLLLHRLYGWPTIPLTRWRDTMAMALANALPASLEGAVEALGLPIQKDAEGHRLMMAMAKPRRPRKGENRDAILWHDDPERRLRLAEYCKNDVQVGRELYRRLPSLSEAEQRLWELDAAINARGFHVDLDLALAAQKIVHAEQEAIDQEVTALTDGKITSVNQVTRLTDLLRERGHHVTGVSKRSVSAVLAGKPDDDVKRILELRREGGLAAARKLGSLIDGIDEDQRLRGCFQFHAASTGRWAGRRFQPQNLKKAKLADLDAVISAIRSGDLARVRAIGAPLALVGDLSRSLICAAPGRVLLGADYSAVESRVLAWLAGETWKLEAYRQFDETGDPSHEAYCQTASRILQRVVTPDDEAGRGIGKICDLAFGYGGGLGAWRKFDNSSTYDDSQIENFKAKWRAQHAATVRFWHALENLLKRALRTGERRTLGSLAAECANGNLYLTLPSGRRLTYPEARLEPGKFPGTTQIVYRDNAKGAWIEQRGWHGTFTENVVQAVSRDLLAGAMLRLEAAGYPICLHVHDEAVAEVPEGAANIAGFLALMTELPDWAAGLPLVAKAWTGERYAKTQPAPTSYARNSTPVPPEPAARREIAPPAAEKRQVPVPQNTKTNSSSTGTHQPAPASPGRQNGHAVVKPAISAIVTTESDFAYIPLPALIGQPLVGGKIICPFHHDRRPSLHVYQDHFHCFVCGARGDHIDWLMFTENMTRAEALRLLAAWDGPTCTPQRPTTMAARSRKRWRSGRRRSRSPRPLQRCTISARSVASTSTPCPTTTPHSASIPNVRSEGAAARCRASLPFIATC